MPLVQSLTHMLIVSVKIDWSDPSAAVNAKSLPLVLFLEDESPADQLNFTHEVLGVALDQDI